MAKNKKDYSDIPIGFNMELAQDKDALIYFGTLSSTQQDKVINYIQGSNTGEEAKHRVINAVKELGKNNSSFC